jgi:glycosyltransferase involved in cell wall biosynthesis
MPLVPADARASRPTVSVVTIFLNAERFLDDAVGSVLAQTIEDWELVLVDDGSTDRSGSMARAHAAAHPARMRYVTHPGGANRGTGRSRQLGVEHARGEFIAFLDADDLYLPEKLERQVAILRQHPHAALVYGPTPHCYGWERAPGESGARSREHRVPRRIGVAPGAVIDPPELARQILRRQADTPATCGVLVRRDAVEAVGGFEGTFAALYEDQAFFYKLLLAFPAYVDGTAWDLYRRHDASLCSVRIRTGEHADDYRPTPARAEFLRWLEAYFREHDVRDRELRRLLDRELWPYRHPVIHAALTSARATARRLGLGRASRALRRMADSLRSSPGSE